MKRAMKLISVFGLVAAILLAACEKISSDKPNKNVLDGPATLVLSITDAPFPVDMIDSALITIVKAEIRDADLAEADTSYPYITVMEDTSLTFNLLDLRNGAIEHLRHYSPPQDILPPRLIDGPQRNYITYGFGIPASKYPGVICPIFCPGW